MDKESEDERSTSYNQILSITDNRIRRRELNKLAQRDSRRRKGDTLKRLQSENTELKRKLAATRQEKDEIDQAPSTNRASTSTETNSTPSETHNPHYQGNSGGNNDTHFGWFTLGDLQQKLSDTSKEVPFHITLGQHFPLSLQQNQTFQSFQQGQDVETSSEVPQTQPGNQDTLWMTTLGGPGIAHAASLMAIPELILYKVCRYYFELLLPFSSSFRTDLVDLSASRPFDDSRLGVSNNASFQPRNSPIWYEDLKVLPDNLLPTDTQLRWGLHPIEIAVIPFPSMRDKILTIVEGMHTIESAASSSQNQSEVNHSSISSSSSSSSSPLQQYYQENPTNSQNQSSPSRSLIYDFGFNSKPNGGRWLQKRIRDWLVTFFTDFVQSLRVWCLANDVFDLSCFELSESFINKYPYLIDRDILYHTNRFRRSRGERPISQTNHQRNFMSGM